MTVDTKEINKNVDKILDNYQRHQGMLVSILQDVQAEFNYLPGEALVRVGEGLDVPLSQVYSVATFYKAFSLKPRGRHSVHVCMGTACHVRGATNVLDRIEQDLCICAGETTPDMKFTLETVNCVGACALGPVVVVDGEYAGQMTQEKVKPLLEKCD
jgi:NADH-quinone oxidoreductase subunit E